MKLVTFKLRGKTAVGIVVDSAVIDLGFCAKSWKIVPQMELFKEGFSDILSFLDAGEISFVMAQRVLDEYSKEKNPLKLLLYISWKK